MVSLETTQDGHGSMPPPRGTSGPALVCSAQHDEAGDVMGGGIRVSAASAARQAALEPGRTVAERYLVRRVLGEGGMGQVLEVEHAALGRRFALKVLRLERWNDELVRRFNREARALARLSTPRVAQVTDFGIDAEIGPFYVMELLEGETLEDRLVRDERVPPLEALSICAELCDALTEVHAAGIVHRDLKPSNVGLPRTGPVGVKLLDFGLAASMDQSFLSKITQSQQILGSLPYMAPEQFNAAEPAPAMDVYAVGVVLYETLTGRLPFLAPSTAALIHQIIAMPPPALSPGLPSNALLDTLLERLLAKDPSQRFASAAAAGHALREAAAALEGRKPVHRLTRIPSWLESIPGTQQVPAVESLGLLPTMAMSESRPPESRPPVQSGTRLSSASADAPAPAPGPMLPSAVCGPTQPASGACGPTLPESPVFARPSRWPLHVLVIGIVGVVLSGVAGVAVVVVLSLLSRPAAVAREASVPAAPPSLIVAPPPAPVPPMPPAVPEPIDVAALEPVAPQVPEPVAPQVPEPVAQPQVPEPLWHPVPEPVGVRTAPREPARARPPTPRDFDRDPAPRGPSFPPPPLPPPQTSVGRPASGGGIIREW